MTVFVGTYTETIHFGSGKVLEGKGEGIHAFRLDPESGALEALGVTRGVVNPSYLAIDGSQHFLYAVSELKTWQGRPGGVVSAFAMNAATGALELLNQQPTYGTDSCHALVDAAGRHVLVANYASGSVSVYPVGSDGTLGAASDFVQHLGSSIVPRRQEGPHAHSITLDAANRFAFVPDLGLDKLMVYRFDARRGRLEPNATPWLKMKPGAGPRHIAFHPKGRFAYLVNELDGTVAALGYHPRQGVFRELQIAPTLPEGFTGQNTCADIHVTPSGRFLYASNRGHDSIAAWRIDQRTGRLAPLGHTATEGATPRNFCIDPSGRFLLVANQDSDSIVTFRIDARSGTLRPTGQVSTVPTPVCVKVTEPARPRRRG
jgi:6-phosphogluconolactonase